MDTCCPYSVRVWYIGGMALSCSSSGTFPLAKGDVVRLIVAVEYRVPLSDVAGAFRLASALLLPHEANYAYIRRHMPLSGSTGKVQSSKRVRRLHRVQLRQTGRLALSFSRHLILSFPAAVSQLTATTRANTCPAGRNKSPPASLFENEPFGAVSGAQGTNLDATRPSGGFPPLPSPPIGVLGPPSCSFHVDAELFKCLRMHPVVRPYREFLGEETWELWE